MDTTAERQRRNRHFWKWVTSVKKLNKKTLKPQEIYNLPEEHKKSFPYLYENDKKFNVMQNIKDFNKIVLLFNEKLRNDPEFQCDGSKFKYFSNLALKEREEMKNDDFIRHY